MFIFGFPSNSIIVIFRYNQCVVTIYEVSYMKKVVIIPDSYKGSLTSKAIAKIMKDVVLSFYPTCNVITVPIADGGEGTVDCFSDIFNAQTIDVLTTGPNGQPIVANYVMHEDTAVMEVANIAGLPLASPQDPKTTTTYGMGRVIKDAIQKGAKTIIIGLGGSATNDAGIGLALSLGAKFYDQEGNMFTPTTMTIDHIYDYDLEDVKSLLKDIHIIAMCDVENPFYGPKGATYIYGPQKGATDQDLALLDKKHQHLSHIIFMKTKKNLQRIKGTGAAGGLGAGIIAFLEGTLKPGIDTILDTIGFDHLINNADMIFTGEGKIDYQSAYGKAISGIAKRAKKQHIPLTAVCGTIDDVDNLYDLGVSAIFSINKKAIDYALSKPDSEENLRFIMEQIMRYTIAIT